MANPTKQDIRTEAKNLEIDLVGFARWHELEQSAPEYDKPSSHSTHLTTLIVLVKRYASGASMAADHALQQHTLGRTAWRLEESAGRLAYWLEEGESMAAVLSAMIPDLRHQPLDFALPSGQGSQLLRQAAVKAGLGTLGLNTMLLTPQFGPRVFLAGVLTDLDLEPDNALESELCLGLPECGRCAAVCPEDAIPRRIPEDATVADSRSLDAEACSRSSQPFGPRRMAEHLKRIFKAEHAAEARAIAAEPVTMQLFHHLTVMKQGAFTGCVRCQTVCPVGDDFPVIEASEAHREMIAGEIRRTRGEGWVSVDSLAVGVP